MLLVDDDVNEGLRRLNYTNFRHNDDNNYNLLTSRQRDKNYHKTPLTDNDNR